MKQHSLLCQSCTAHSSWIQSDIETAYVWTCSLYMQILVFCSHQWLVGQRCEEVVFSKSASWSFLAEHIRPSLLLWLQSGWIPVVDQSSVDSSTDRQAGWTLISPSMFDRTECKNNINPSGPYGWFWEDQLLRAFKAIIFISHPQWAILISDEGPVVWRQKEHNERTTCVHLHLHFCIFTIRMSKMLYFLKSNKAYPLTYFSYFTPLFTSLKFRYVYMNNSLSNPHKNKAFHLCCYPCYASYE